MNCKIITAILLGMFIISFASANGAYEKDIYVSNELDVPVTVITKYIPHIEDERNDYIQKTVLVQPDEEVFVGTHHNEQSYVYFYVRESKENGAYYTSSTPWWRYLEDSDYEYPFNYINFDYYNTDPERPDKVVYRINPDFLYKFYPTPDGFELPFWDTRKFNVERFVSGELEYQTLDIEGVSSLVDRFHSPLTSADFTKIYYFKENKLKSVRYLYIGEEFFSELDYFLEKFNSFYDLQGQIIVDDYMSRDYEDGYVRFVVNGNKSFGIEFNNPQLLNDWELREYLIPLHEKENYPIDFNIPGLF